MSQRCLDGRTAVVENFDIVFMTPQRPGDMARQVFFIFDNKYSHGMGGKRCRGPSRLERKAVVTFVNGGYVTELLQRGAAAHLCL